MAILNSCVLDGLSFYFADILNIRVGNSLSDGLVDFLLFGVFKEMIKPIGSNLFLFALLGQSFISSYSSFLLRNSKWPFPEW